jgi:hypothetical protein
MHSHLLAPVVALVLWSFVMCAWLYATRIPAIRQGRIVYDPHRPACEFHARLPAEVRGGWLRRDSVSPSISGTSAG